MILFISFSPASEGQTEQLKNPEQFLFPEFSTGKVTMRTGNGYEVLLNYNIVSEKINYIEQGKILELTNSNVVDSVLLSGRKFIPVGKVFYEVLSEKPYPLSVQHKAKVKQAPKRDSYGIVPETSSSSSLNYVMEDLNYYKLADKEVIIENIEVYWIKINDSIQSFREISQLIKIFPGFKVEIKSFIRKDKIKFENNEDIKKLIAYCNTLMK
jgi:hypothetical protein